MGVVAREMGIPLTILFLGGARYTTNEGISDIVPRDHAFIQIGTGERDLSSFWRKVEKLERQKRARTR